MGLRFEWDPKKAETNLKKHGISFVMKRNTATKTETWEMRKEYDFSNARPNKYAKKYAEGVNIVMIDPDLVKFFPDSDSVNSALRALVSIFPKLKPREKPKRSLTA
jgi:uncharacterized DUF497 family protein